MNTPLVLLHAFPLDSEMWDAAGGILATERTVLAPDFPGFGRAPETVTFSMDECADAVVEMLDHQAIDRAIICGVSMGGYVALSLWARHPERVAALILADTRAEADSPEARAKRASQAEAIAAHGAEEFLNGLVRALIGPATVARDPAIINLTLDMARRASPDALVAALDGLAQRNDATEFLRTITVPTLVLVGADDSITPPALSQRMHSAIPGSDIAVLEGVGHLTPLEDPVAFTESVTSFLHKHRL